MQLAAMIFVLAVAMSLGLFAFVSLFREGEPLRPAASTLGTTSVLAVPGIAFQFYGTPVAFAVSAGAILFYLLVRLLLQTALLRQGASWVSAALLLICLAVLR